MKTSDLPRPKPRMRHLLSQATLVPYFSGTALCGIPLPTIPESKGPLSSVCPRCAQAVRERTN